MGHAPPARPSSFSMACVLDTLGPGAQEPWEAPTGRLGPCASAFLKGSGKFAKEKCKFEVCKRMRGCVVLYVHILRSQRGLMFPAAHRWSERQSLSSGSEPKESFRLPLVPTDMISILILLMYGQT